MGRTPSCLRAGSARTRQPSVPPCATSSIGSELFWIRSATSRRRARSRSTAKRAGCKFGSCRPTKSSLSPGKCKRCLRSEAFMFLARVTGSVVATQKLASMTGRKLLTVEPLRVDPAKRDRLVSTGRTFVVVDTVGAGQGEMVLIVQGSSARLTPETEKLPIDAAIVGIVDTVNVENQTIFPARG